MNFSTFSKSSLIAYLKYFTTMLCHKEDKNVINFLEDCKKELSKRN